MLVSIIVPYFNDPINIYYSVNSALKQTHSKIEIIIIDDENSIKSKKILNKYFRNNKKIKIFTTKNNSGVAYARNLGIKKSKGKLIAFLDSDDTWKKQKLKLQVQEIKSKKLDVCYTNYSASHSDQDITYKVKPPKRMNYNDLIKQCPICCSSVVIKSNILKEYNFSPIKTKEDYELWLRLAKNNYIFGGVNSYLTYYRLSNKSLSSKHLNKIYNAFKIFYTYNNYSLIKSIIFTTRLYFNAFIKKYF
jgi:teichuronic acid biosynthesis glycosyltransferase TuaG